MAKALADYRARRDFTRTAEPSGQRNVRSAPYPRFVIQMHDATRLHFDLRLEVDGVLKSWAVPNGPSFDPKIKRLAVEVEDHPLDYGDFEGTIPQGEYGGGTVMVWDRGFWSPATGMPVGQSLREGELKFNAGGGRLRGGWVLVRLKTDRDGPGKTNWLLIKHRDEWACPAGKGDVSGRDARDDHANGGKGGDARSVASGRTMAEIAAGKPPGPTPFMLQGADPATPDAVWAPDPLPDPARKARTPRPIPVKAQGYRVAGVAISNPTKVLWPATGSTPAVTKIELAEYLATVGPWMLEHIAGRPCSLLRAPDGIGGETFFQRHQIKGAKHVVGVAIGGESEPYLQIDSVEGLVAMGQLAALELHPWNCAPHAPQVPGRLVLDLDPAPDVPFSQVVAAAHDIRQRLSRLGLISFCKTTGGKGLHVVTPLAPDAHPLDWGAAKTFAHTICAQMAEARPDRYVTTIAVRHRVGRILLDYLRNDRTATAVAPLSPRARPGAPVSMPLSWSEVAPDLDPRRFTIASAPALLARSTAWRAYGRSARSLRTAIGKLIGSAP